MKHWIVFIESQTFQTPNYYNSFVFFPLLLHRSNLQYSMLEPLLLVHHLWIGEAINGAYFVHIEQNIVDCHEKEMLKYSPGGKLRARINKTDDDKKISPLSDWIAFECLRSFVRSPVCRVCMCENDEPLKMMLETKELRHHSSAIPTIHFTNLLTCMCVSVSMELSLFCQCRGGGTTANALHLKYYDILEPLFISMEICLLRYWMCIVNIETVLLFFLSL